jgi:signal transduction histidine kinase
LDVQTVVRRYALIGVVALAIAFGALSLAVARHDPAGSLAGASTLGAMAELAAGWSLVAAGLVFWIRHPDNRFGILLTAAGFAGFVPEWSNPGVGTAFGFTLGLVGFTACTVLVAHAALTYPTGRLRSRLDVAAVVLSYAGALVLLGVLPATVFAPRATGCLECPRNLLLTRTDTGLFDTFNRYGLRIGLGWLAALGVLLLWRVVRSARGGAKFVLPALISAAAYLGLVAWDVQHSLARGILATDSFDQRVWRLEAVALVAFAFAVGLALVRERQARASVARFVVELGELPKSQTVRDALAQTLGDAQLELAYRRPDADGYVDGLGNAIDASPGAGQVLTPIQRGGTAVGALVHSARLLEHPGLLEGALAAARIAVENEQLQAGVRAQLEDLRASRVRIVESGDAERRRLERDLHDGAQQSLLALSFDLRLARSAVEAYPDPDVTTMLASAADETQAALGELRELAHGLYPAILAETGLEPALESLADEAPLPVELGTLTPERYSASVETAAYLTVAEAIGDAATRRATFVSVNVCGEGDELVVATEDDGADRISRFMHLEDRIGALGGTLEVGPTTIRAVIPCE